MSAPDHASPFRVTFRVSHRTLEIISLSLVLLLAAYLRLNHLEWTEFKLDEAHLSQIAFDMARHDQIPLAGIGSSVGIVNPPLAAWLLAIPYAVSSSPIVATAFIALLNVVAVALCYGLSRKMFAPLGERAWLAALIAALLFAVAPWAVIHSRKVWAQDLLPFFVMLYVWFGHRAFVQRKAWSLIWHGVVLAAMIQIHYSAVWLIPVSAVWLIAFARRVRVAPLIVTALIGAAAFAPFVVADGLRGWPSVTRLLEMTQQPATTDTTALHLAQITTTGEEIHSLAGPQEFENYRALVPFNDGVCTLIGLLVIGGLIVAAIDVLAAIRRRKWDDRSAASFLLVTWLLLPVLVQLSHRTPLYVHYFLVVLPAPFMLIGYLFGQLPDRRWLKTLSVVCIAVIAIAQTYEVIALQQFVASRSTPGGMSVPIGYYEQLVNQAKNALTQTGGTEIIVNAHGSNPSVDEAPAVFDFLLNDMPHRFVDVGQAIALYPALSQIQIDYAPDGAQPITNARRELVEQVTLRATESPAAIYRVEDMAQLPCAVHANPARWSNGVSLLSAQIDPLKPGGKAALRLCLKIDQPVTDEYHWTAQLWDKTGRRWAQVDDNGYPSRYWHAGDVIVQALTLEVPTDAPPGDYVLRVGQYTWPDVKPVLTIDVAGNPQSDAAEIPVRVEH
jgi:4-amino-4-deoxy-L-arabinose transferase-like glycosyltransferase